MIDHELITIVLQPDDLTYGSGDLDHARQIMLAHLGHYFFNTFLVGVPTAHARQTGVAVGCLVSSEEQHPATLQSLDAYIGEERVIPVGRLNWGRKAGVGDRRVVPDVSRRRLICLGVPNVKGFTPAILLPDEAIINGRIR